MRSLLKVKRLRIVKTFSLIFEYQLVSNGGDL